ncbi:hypothetical protein I7I53_09033 [Histoplasma capsulatum var. duboisii H88]|uniref:Uncharacterized protein n=1 Tax=Ajellomyces capsulatus (strain H88) TaxID=544711 RepID=A0A8A1L3B4_AJEC8|nr:hypothetical protein I7I53_09033 [Histoplasma capsulatum var. duboisii H88]
MSLFQHTLRFPCSDTSRKTQGTFSLFTVFSSGHYSACRCIPKLRWSIFRNLHRTPPGKQPNSSTT